MGKSLKLGSLAGIRIQVHWTFSIIVALVLVSGLASGNGLVGALASLGFVLAIFGCVILHELGHALAARAYGIKTRDITLLPIGGVARLERMPRKPVQELVVAVAGPAVNVGIAALLLAVLLPTLGSQILSPASMMSGGLLQRLITVNLVLVAFNMLPAFPLDGGRVLRALLAMTTEYEKATRIAARVGQICAVGLGLLGLMNPFLFFIAAFIFFGAAAESRQVAVTERMRGYTVRDGMLRSFRAVPAIAAVDDVAERLLDSPQRDYPVVRDGTVVGILRRTDLTNALELGTTGQVSDIMQTDVEPVDESEPLASVLESIRASGGETVPVTNAGGLTGLLDVRQVLELAETRARLRQETKDLLRPGGLRISANLN